VKASVSAQPYVMTTDSLCCYWKRPKTSKSTVVGKAEGIVRV